MVFHVLVLLCTATTIRQGQKAFASFPCSSVQVSEGCSCQVRWATQLQAHYTTEFLSLCIQLLGQAEKRWKQSAWKKVYCCDGESVKKCIPLWIQLHEKRTTHSWTASLHTYKNQRDMHSGEEKKGFDFSSASCLYWDLLHSLSNASYIYWKA